MSSDKRSFGCVEYTLIIAICAMIGMILYATLEHSPRETHATSQPSQTTEKISNRPSSNPSIGNKIGSVKGAIRAAITTSKPTQQSIRYLPIHLQKATRTIRLIPEGQEGD
jgi:hypothetical protein